MKDFLQIRSHLLKKSLTGNFISFLQMRCLKFRENWNIWLIRIVETFDFLKGEVIF